jgi:hypothetical protein
MKSLRLIPLTGLALFGLFAMVGVANAAPELSSSAYTCAGGTIPAGHYSSLLVKGVCYASAGTIDVRGNLTIAAHALLDGAATPGDPVASPVLPATVIVGGNVWVGKGAVLVLGCSPAGGCHAVTYDRIGGNLTAIDSQAVLMQAVSIGGNVSILGGGGGVVGGAASGGCFAPTAPIPSPWSLDPALSNPNTGSPQYTDLEDTTIGGNYTVIGVRTCYLGSFRDQVRGNVTFAADVTSDPDGMEIGSNLAGGNMVCLANQPAVQFGESGAAPNMVGGYAAGQCGFKVVLLNPPPAVGAGPGVWEHISVSTRSMKTYHGAHAQIGPSVTTLNLGTTAAGDQLLIALNNVVFTGSGLTGKVAVVPGGPLGQSGETVAITARPNGWQSFEAFDKCSCHFGGRSGAISITAYGTTSPTGVTQGTFLITSGGTGHGGLSTLAGYGTFSSIGQPAGMLRLVEHLAVT